LNSRPKFTLSATSAFGQNIGRVLPGNPSVVVQNVPGAASPEAANWLYNSAPRDGSTLALILSQIAFQPLFGNKAARFDATQFNWIGSLNRLVEFVAVSAKSNIAEIAIYSHASSYYRARRDPMAR
jgi:tripartite-type tricarboxylate transporter receptor subunit TctC